MNAERRILETGAVHLHQTRSGRGQMPEKSRRRVPNLPMTRTGCADLGTDVAELIHVLPHLLMNLNSTPWTSNEMRLEFSDRKRVSTTFLYIRTG